MLMGCQTQIKVAGEDHRTVTEKWYELSRYAESRLPEFGVTLTSQLSLLNDKGKKSYILKNLKLQKKENHFNINLLTPLFKNKFICTPVCMQLLEYDRISTDKGATLLKQYFDHHEFELFKFYGDIYLLNKNLDDLISLEPSFVREYLQYLASKNETHDSIDAFHQYLSRALSAAEYRYYLENRTPLKQKLQLSKWWSERGAINSNSEKKDWNLEYGNDGQVAENVLWVLSTNKESKKWSSIDKKTSQQEENRERLANWKTALKTVIQPGDTVCSFQSNLIGTVVSRSQKAIKVNLFGEAKRIVNGIIMDVDAGFLFGEKQEVSFLPIQKSEIFSFNDIAVCNLI